MILKDKVVMVADTPTYVSNIYPLETVQKMLDKYKDKYIPGRLGMPNSTIDISSIDLNEIAFSSKLTRIEEGKLYADIIILDNPQGKLFMDTCNTAELIEAAQFRTACVVQINSIVDGIKKLEIIDIAQINYTTTPS